MSDEVLNRPEQDPLENSPGQEPAYLANPDEIKNQRFNRAMAAAQQPVVTPILIAINVVVFICMLTRGFSFTNPSAESFLRWGADFGPLTTHGEWWRIVTSVFVHASLFHLLMNMVILWSIGIFTERLFGRIAFILLYLFAGIGGNLASLAWQPFTVAMGASGAVFGLYGGLLAILLLHRHTVPKPRVMAMAKSAAIFIAINLAYGLMQTNVDMAAHIGGLASGFLLGCGLTGSLIPADPDWRQPRNLAVALAATALVVIAVLRMPVVDDWRSDLSRLTPLDTKSQHLFNDALRKAQFHQMNAVQFAEVIDKEILPPWNAERENLSKLKVSKQQRVIADRLVEYMSLRSEAWSLMKTGFATTDPAMVRLSFQKQAAAQAVLNSINQKFANAAKPDAH